MYLERSQIMDASEVSQIYKDNYSFVTNLIAGKDDISANVFITNTYHTLYKQDPAFMWFALGGLVSSQVGTGIFTSSLTANTPIHNLDTLTENLPLGNKSIFIDLVPLYLTYLEVGLDNLINYHLSGENEEDLFSDNAIEAFKSLDVLHSWQIQKATELNVAPNSVEVITELFSNEEMHDIAIQAANKFAAHEQNIVQDMYSQDFTEILMKLMNLPEFMHVTGITINGVYISMNEHVTDPSSLYQRIEFAKVLIEETAKNFTDPESLQAFNKQLNITVHTNTNLANPYYLASNHAELDGTDLAYINKYESDLKNEVESFFIQDDFWDKIELNLIHANAEASLQDSFTPSMDDINIHTEEVNLEALNIESLTDEQYLNIFLMNNPEYDVIAMSAQELYSSGAYFRTPCPYGTTDLYFSNPALPYLTNNDYLIYSLGEFVYFPIDGETRAITFPMIYNTQTGDILTVPMGDNGEVNANSTIDLIYNNPEIFNQTGDIKWFNPYYNGMIEIASQMQFVQHNFNIPTTQDFINAVVAPNGDILFNLAPYDTTTTLVTTDNTSSGDGNCTLNIYLGGDTLVDYTCTPTDGSDQHYTM